MIIILDTFPTSSTGKKPGKTPSLLDQCQNWINEREAAGDRILVPAISYYEALRELELLGAEQQIRRLKDYCLRPSRFIPLTTAHLESSAKLWAEVRKLGLPTADRHALDGDVILAAQALSFEFPATEFVIATTNPGHLSRFVPAQLWSEI